MLRLSADSGANTLAYARVRHLPPTRINEPPLGVSHFMVASPLVIMLTLTLVASHSELKMPSIVLHTNVAVEDVRAFVSEFSKFCSETLGKTERFVSIQFQHNPDMSFGGTFEPTFVLTITSLSNINPEANERYSKAFFDHFEEKLGVSGERGYITFFDPGRQFMGFNGVTVETAFPSKK